MNLNLNPDPNDGKTKKMVVLATIITVIVLSAVYLLVAPLNAAERGAPVMGTSCQLLRSGSLLRTIPLSNCDSDPACDATIAAQRDLDKAKTSGEYRYNCRRERTARVTYQANPTVPPPTNTATLTWTPPTLQTDGSPVSNLAGYRIHYWSNVEPIAKVREVQGAATTRVVLSDLSGGTWSFKLRAYTSLGAESGDSNTTTKVITR